MKEKWYEKTWAVILMIIFVFPIGIYHMWANMYEWDKNKKIKLTAIGIGALIIYSILIIINIIPENKESTMEATNSSSSYTTTKEDEEFRFYKFSIDDPEGIVGVEKPLFYGLAGKYDKNNVTVTLIIVKDSVEYDRKEYKGEDKISWTPSEVGEYRVYLRASSDGEETKSNPVKINVITAEQKQAKIDEKAQLEESKKQAEAQAKAELEERKKQAQEAKEASYNTGITFDNIARNPDTYQLKNVKFTGKIVQVIEGTTSSSYRMAIDSDYDKMVLLTISSDQLSNNRILEDDIITIRGVSYGLATYKSTLGGNITVPQIKVDYFTR